MKRGSTVIFLLAGALALAGCTNSPFSAPPAFTMEGATALRESGPGVLRLRFTKTLIEPHRGAYVPVESASAALDAQNDRIYQGTTQGVLYVFDSAGRQRGRYDAGGAIEASPAIDSARRQMYLPVVDGTIHALDASTLELKWKEDVGFAVRNTPVLTDDALYIVTETDQVNALAREDGAVLWTYRRPPGEQFSVAGQAGLTLVDGRIYTGFSDGVVVALDASDGAVLWEADTSEDVEEVDSNRPSFADVDVTPVVSGDQVYVASYAAGLYALSRTNGSVEWRDRDRRAIVKLADAGRWLIVLSATDGISAIDRTTRETIWKRPIERGSPTSVRVMEENALLLYGESRGGLLALTVREGREVGRLEAGHGFTAQAAVLDGLGAILSNSGSLFVFRVPTAL
ncbi:MAG: PQQ-binding-like beta-propeller repeat protein [Polyangiaceae bacterium]|nr:PQQ-binding-like beta-propeller repeat protein [Polyangiaceae bacterium]